MEVTNSLLVWRLSSNAGSDFCGIGDPCLLLQKTWFFFWVIIFWSRRHEITGNDQDPIHKLRAWGCCHYGWRSQPHIPCQTNHFFFFFFFFFFSLLHLWCSTSTSTPTNPFINLFHSVKANRSITPQMNKVLFFLSNFMFQWFCESTECDHWRWVFPFHKNFVFFFFIMKESPGLLDFILIHIFCYWSCFSFSFLPHTNYAFRVLNETVTNI